MSSPNLSDVTATSSAASPSSSPSSQRELVITRVLNAPRELVFQAWTDPNHVAQWWGPKCFTNPVCEIDARPGGAILIHMMAPEGTVYPMQGVFEEVVVPEHIVMKHSAVEDENGQPQLEIRQTVTFVEQNGQTKLTLRAIVLKAIGGAVGAMAGMEEGWNQSLDCLTDFLAQA